MHESYCMNCQVTLPEDNHIWSFMRTWPDISRGIVRFRQSAVGWIEQYTYISFFLHQSIHFRFHLLTIINDDRSGKLVA